MVLLIAINSSLVIICGMGYHSSFYKTTSNSDTPFPVDATHGGAVGTEQRQLLGTAWGTVCILQWAQPAQGWAAEEKCTAVPLYLVSPILLQWGCQNVRKKLLGVILLVTKY